jgi:hypothetical protein
MSFLVSFTMKQKNKLEKDAGETVIKLEGK